MIVVIIVYNMALIANKWLNRMHYDSKLNALK